MPVRSPASSRPSEPSGDPVFETRASTSPYPGLRPFEPHEAEIFFGRETHTDRLLEILRRERFLTVIGPSGCGKSSLVRAGMLPALAAGWLGTGSVWRIAIMRPGDRPLRGLALALLQPQALAAELSSAPEVTKTRARTPGTETRASPVSASDVASAEAELRRGPLGLVELVGDARGRSSGPQAFSLLVLVDQFEEIFTYAASGATQSDESVAFVNLLLAQRAATDRGIHVALTMRSDFLGYCMRFLELPEAINRAQYLTPRLTRDQLRQAVVAPARVFGGDVDDALASELINAVADDPDQLPVLQHALARMWPVAQQANAQAPFITRAAFEAVGGVAGALPAHAEAVLEELAPEQQTLAELLFRCITERAGGDAGGRHIRRPQRLEQIAFACACKWQELVPVVEAFAREGVSFLTHGLALDRDTVIDLSHEALIRQWQRLRGWVASEAERAADYDRWRERARQRAAGGELLHGADLALARPWRDGRDGWRPSARWATRYAVEPGEAAEREFASTLAFIAESEERERAEREAAARERIAAEQQRLLAEKEAAEVRAQAEQEKAEAAARERMQAEAHARKSRRQAVLAAVVAVIASVFAVLAGWLWLDASESRKTAIAKGQEAVVRQLMSEAYFYADKDPDRGQLLAVEAYRQAPGPATEAVLRQIYTGQEGLKITLQGHRDAITSAAFSPDGKTMLTASKDGTARLWKAASGTLLATLQGHKASVNHAAFSPDGGIVVTASEDKTARLWETASGKLLATLEGHKDQVNHAAFSHPGSPCVHKGIVGSADFSPDGQMLATTSWDGTARLWEVASGRLLATLSAHKVRVSSASFSPDGRTLMTAGEDGTARLWDVAIGRPLVVLQGDKTGVYRAAFSPDGRKVMTTGGVALVSKDNSARLWEAASGKLLATLEGHEQIVRQAAFSPDGRTVLTAGGDGTARLWEAASGKPLLTLEGHEGRKRDTFFADASAGFSPDGKTVATSFGSTTQLWEAASGRPLTTLEGHGAAAFSPDGRMVVTSIEGTARVWDAASGKSLATLQGQGLTANAVFSPDSKRVLTAGSATYIDLDDIKDKAARLWDAASGKLVATLEGHKDTTHHAAFTPDGRTVVTASFDGTARLWETAGGKPLAKLEGHQLSVAYAAFSPDGRTVVTASIDATARLWDTASGRALAILQGHEGAVVYATFSPDGGMVMTTGLDGTARLWRCGVCRPAEALIADMLHRVGRELSDGERAQSGLRAESSAVAESAMKPRAPQYGQ